MTFFIFSLIYCAGTAFCMTKVKHFKVICNRPPSKKQKYMLHFSAWCAMVISVILSLQTWNTGVGLVMFAGLLVAAFAPIILLLTYGPKFVIPTAIATLTLAIMSQLTFSA